jgi:hypothetical protein
MDVRDICPYSPGTDAHRVSSKVELESVYITEAGTNNKTPLHLEKG